jgi:predicted TIM-barrel fold metal-dependent hydrolase
MTGQIRDCLPPDRNPRRPEVVLPRGAVDTHVHIFEPGYKLSPGRGYNPPDSTLADLEHLHATLGVDRVVFTQPSVYGVDNSAILNGMAALNAGTPNRARAVVAITLDMNDDELAALDAEGVRGVRLNTDNKGGMPIEIDSIPELAARIAPFGWHIEFLVNLDEAAGFADAVAGLAVPIVLGHLGYPRAGARDWIKAPAFAGLLALLAGGRCWVKLTGPYRISGAADLPYEDVDAAAARLAQAAPGRLIWGSDWPHVMMKKPMPNDGPLCDLLARWVPDAAARSRILVENPMELYGFRADERITR